MFKIDTHVHTAETSACAKTMAREAVQLYKESGYQGIIITDHYYEYYFETSVERTWESKNIIIIQAHPFRTNMIVASSEDIHGVEIYNGNCRHGSGNELALAYAKKHSLMMSSGSDFHEPENLARGGMLFEHDISRGRSCPGS